MSDKKKIVYVTFIWTKAMAVISAVYETLEDAVKAQARARLNAHGSEPDWLHIGEAMYFEDSNAVKIEPTQDVLISGCSMKATIR